MGDFLCPPTQAASGFLSHDQVRGVPPLEHWDIVSLPCINISLIEVIFYVPETFLPNKAQ